MQRSMMASLTKASILQSRTRRRRGADHDDEDDGGGGGERPLPAPTDEKDGAKNESLRRMESIVTGDRFVAKIKAQVDQLGEKALIAFPQLHSSIEEETAFFIERMEEVFVERMPSGESEFLPTGLVLGDGTVPQSRAGECRVQQEIPELIHAQEL